MMPRLLSAIRANGSPRDLTGVQTVVRLRNESREFAGRFLQNGD